MHVTEICEVFGLGTPKGPPSYVARGELGRVSRLATTTGSWAIKEIQLFLPTILMIAIGASATLLYAVTLFVPLAGMLKGLARP